MKEMKEYILQFGEGLYNDDTGEMCFKPEYVGELIRCKNCKHWESIVPHAAYGICAKHSTFLTTESDHYCSKAERRTDE